MPGSDGMRRAGEEGGGRRRRSDVTAPAARRQAYLETLDTIANQIGKFEHAVARMASDPAMDVAGAPELLGRAECRLGDAIEH